MENNETQGVGPVKKKAGTVVKILTVVAVVLVLLIAGLIGILTYRFAMENLDLRMPMGSEPTAVAVETGTP